MWCLIMYLVFAVQDDYLGPSLLLDLQLCSFWLADLLTMDNLLHLPQSSYVLLPPSDSLYVHA